MREPIRDRHRLQHILNAIDIIQERAEGMTYESLTEDKILFARIVYYTMIIGEASYKLSRAFVANHPQLEWKVIANMRHHLVHGYYQVHAKDIWSVIQNDLAPLKVQIEKLLAETDWQQWERQEFQA